MTFFALFFLIHHRELGRKVGVTVALCIVDCMLLVPRLAQSYAFTSLLFMAELLVHFALSTTFLFRPALGLAGPGSLRQVERIVQTLRALHEDLLHRAKLEVGKIPFTFHCFDLWRRPPNGYY